MNNNTILDTEVKGLKIEKIFKTDTVETLLITLEKGNTFPKHTSPRDALLVVLEGSINFFIEGKSIGLAQHQIYNFEKNIEHYVTANQNSKFLIIR